MERAPLPVRIKVAGRWYGGWDSVTVTRGIEQAAAEWDLGASAPWPGGTFRPAGGDLVEVWLGDQIAVRGYIEQDDDGYTDTTSTLSFGGRSLVGDLVDSAAPLGTYRGLTLGQLAAAWGAPFGVGVRVDADSPVIISHRVQPGETIVASLQRAAAAHQRLITDLPDGRLLITAAGAARADGMIVAGQNVLSGTRSIDLSQRYRTYICRGQTLDEGAAIAQVREQVVDAVYPTSRPRTLHLTADGGGPHKTASDRVRVEAARRAGLSHTYTYTVPGWHQPDGSLWAPNERILVSDPRFDLDGEELLATVVSASADDSGPTTTLTLAPVSGWQPLPVTKSTISGVALPSGLGISAEERAGINAAGAGAGGLAPSRPKERTP